MRVQHAPRIEPGRSLGCASVSNAAALGRAVNDSAGICLAVTRAILIPTLESVVRARLIPLESIALECRNALPM